MATRDKNIAHQDIPSGESGAFLHKVIRGLMSKHDINDVTALAVDRFRLRDQVETSSGKRTEEFQCALNSLMDWMILLNIRESIFGLLLGEKEQLAPYGLYAVTLAVQ